MEETMKAVRLFSPCNVRCAARERPRLGGTGVKVFIEACLLTDERKVLACQTAKDVGAHFVKTSTGFN